MKFEDALKKIDGAESVGGQLIVHRGGKNILVGKSVQGLLIVEENEEAKAVAVEAGVKVEATITVDSTGEAPPEPTTHDLHLKDDVKLKDKMR